MYPSNGLVDVVVRGGLHSAIVSDDGGAMSEALGVGIHAHPNDRQLKRLISAQGLEIKGGVISSPPVPFAEVPVSILLVANAAKDIASWLYDHAKIKRHRDFRKALENFLWTTFEERLTRNAIVVGKRKQHTFANVIVLPGEDLLIIDPVSREPSSINARVVSNLDVAQAENPKIKQRLVYDDEEEWTPQDLGLLGIVGVPIVPFSRSPQIIQRIARGA